MTKPKKLPIKKECPHKNVHTHRVIDDRFKSPQNRIGYGIETACADCGDVLKQIPMKDGKWSAEKKPQLVLHTNDSEGGRIQAEEIGYQKGRREGLAKGIYIESRKKSLYVAQGAFIGACFAGIIIIIITTLV
jgi:hypothetical protein